MKRIIRNTYFLLVLGLSSFGWLFAQNSRYEIIQTGYYDGKPYVDICANWYGLTEQAGDSYLAEVELKIVEFGYPKQYLVTTECKTRSVILLGTKDMLVDGRVEGDFYYGLALAPGCDFLINLGNENYKIEVIGEPMLNEGDNEPEFVDCQVYLKKDNVKQLILDKFDSFGGSPMLVWTGDMNRDGELDLLIDRICKDGEETVELLLSNSLDSTKLVNIISQKSSF